MFYALWLKGDKR